MLDLKQYNDEDPLKRLVEKETGELELSPMDPPDISDKDAKPANLESYHDCLKQLVNEHQDCSERLVEFEKAILFFRENGLQKQEEIKESINSFFSYLDNTILPHNRKEEKTLFHLLNKRLEANEIYSKNDSSNTVVDIMEDEHSKLIQLSSLAFNLLGLATRLPDHNSRLIVLDVAMEQSLALIELLRLHIYREDHIVFDLAKDYLSEDELSLIAEEIK